MTSCCCWFSQPAREIKSSRKGSIARRMVDRCTPQYSLRCTEPWRLTDVLSDKSSFWIVRRQDLADVVLGPGHFFRSAQAAGKYRPEKSRIELAGNRQIMPEMLRIQAPGAHLER